jgi:hypothetical protein
VKSKLTSTKAVRLCLKLRSELTSIAPNGTHNLLYLSLASADIAGLIDVSVQPDLSGSDHLPILISIKNKEIPITFSQSRFNYKRVDWQLFIQLADDKFHKSDLADPDIDVFCDNITHDILNAAYAANPVNKPRTYHVACRAFGVKSRMPSTRETARPVSVTAHA